MNFKSIKIFLILLLLAINVFLLYNYISYEKSSAKIEPETVEEVVSILDNNGIGLDGALIPLNYPQADIIESGFDSTYYESLASAISFSERESVNIMPDNSLRLIMKNGDCLVLNRRFEFDFTTKEKQSENYSKELVTLINSSSFFDTELTNAEKKIIDNFVYPKAFGESVSAFSYQINAVRSDNNVKIIKLSQTIDNIYIREHTMFVELCTDKISRAYGTWFFPQNSERYSSELYDQMSVLFAELDYKKSLINADNGDSDASDVQNDASDGYEITGLDFNYCIYWNASQDGIFFIPSWKISTSTNETRYYNAVNCQLYE